MALVFPRPMPLVAGVSQVLDIQRVDLQSPTVGGAARGVTLGAPRWIMSLTIDGDEDETAEWTAWIDSLRGTQRTFFAGDLTRPYPKAYPDGFDGVTRAGGGAFDGTASTWSINSDRDVVTLTGQPANLAVMFRDYLMWRWDVGGSARRALARSIERTTGSAGGVVTFAIEPPLPPFVPSDAIADMARPCCIMRQTQDSRGLGELNGLHEATGAISAVQDHLV